MDKKQRFALRKTTMGLVSAAIIGVTIIPLIGGTALAQEGDSSAEVTSITVASPPKLELRNTWTANTVSEIEQEIKAQLAEQSTDEEVDNMDYVIQWGDTVWGITQAFGLDQDLFVQVNAIENPDLIYADDVVTLNLEKVVRQEQTAKADVKEQAVTGTPVKTETVKESNKEVVTNNNKEESKKPAKAVIADDLTPAQKAPAPTEAVMKDPTKEEIAKVKKEIEDDSGNFTNESGNETDETVKEDEIIEEIPAETEKDDDAEIIEEETIDESEDVVIPEDKAEIDGELIDEEIISEEEEEVVETPDTPIVEDGGETEDGEVDEPVQEDEVKDVIVNRTINRNFEIKHGVKYVEDETLEAGLEIIIQEGKNGVRTETVTQRVVNGVVESETVTNTVVKTEAVDEIVRVGTEKVEYKNEVVTGSLNFPTVRRNNANLDKGVERVVQAGQKGTYEAVFQVVYVNGVLQENERILLSDKVTKEPVAQIIEVGTKEVKANPMSSVDPDLFNQEMLKFINAERASVGVKPLKYDADLQKGTLIRADELVEIGGLRVDGVGHVRPDGSPWREAFYYLDFEPEYHLGENLAYNYLGYEVAEAVMNGTRSYENALAEMFFDQYKASPGHYQNMINSSYSEFASVSISNNDGINGGYYARIYNVQIFSNYGTYSNM